MITALCSIRAGRALHAYNKRCAKILYKDILYYRLLGKTCTPDFVSLLLLLAP